MNASDVAYGSECRHGLAISLNSASLCMTDDLATTMDFRGCFKGCSALGHNLSPRAWSASALECQHVSCALEPWSVTEAHMRIRGLELGKCYTASLSCRSNDLRTDGQLNHALYDRP